jgi:hypothetical protein
MAVNRRGRRWLAYSVRTMLVLILAIAVCLGWWVNSSRNQRAVVAAVRAYDVAANISYDNERFDTPGNAMGGMGFTKEIRPWWLPASLERRLGRDYFYNVDTVAFGQGPAAPGAARRGEILREVARLRRLRQLVLYFSVSDVDIANLVGLRSLERLELGEDCPELTDVSLRTLSRISSLEALEIHDAPITDAGLVHLGKLPQLKSLALGKAQTFSPVGNRLTITGEGIASLAGLPSLIEMEIHSAELTGDGLKHLAPLRHLKRLRLKGGSFTDNDLRFLAPLKDLESLEIVATNIDGTGFRHLAGLSKLTDVCLEGRNVTDEAVPYLARLPSLKSVMIYGTRVTAAGLEEFRSAPRLSQMGLIPAVTGDTKRLRQALPNCGVLNGGKSL